MGQDRARSGNHAAMSEKPRYIAGSISPIGEDRHRCCRTHPIAQVWRVISRGIAPPVEGWGTLSENKGRR